MDDKACRNLRKEILEHFKTFQASNFVREPWTIKFHAWGIPAHVSSQHFLEKILIGKVCQVLHGKSLARCFFWSFGQLLDLQPC